jgi:Cof subfamily protein (haloacid dehalogenase superfamily)
LHYRLIALDLDGTIVGADMRVSPRVREALRQAREAGAHVILASGRPFEDMRVFAQDLNIHEPMICFQGAVVQNPVTEEVYLHVGVPLDLAHEFIRLARQQAWDHCLFLDNRLYAERITPRVRFYAEYSPVGVGIYPVDDLLAILSHEPTKLVVTVDAEQGAAVDAMLQAQFSGRLRIMRSFPCFVEATNLAASKGQALALVAEMLHVPQSETMAIGDNDNDADMVAWAGLGVAMGNASPAVRTIADWVAPPIEEEGAARAIERFVLERHGG